jgi:XTP/dITP diphosphohydrolase
MKESLTFVTNNPEKQSDIKTMLSNSFQINFVTDLELPEIQSLSPAVVASYKAKIAYEKIKKPVVVSDSGLVISALNAFPGALVKFVNTTIGQEGLIKLLKDEENRDAFFVAAISYSDEEKKSKTFIEKDKGTISLEPKGKGWHFDRIFIPEGENKTWAELGRKEKNRDSAFKRALERLSKWLLAKKKS